MSSKRPSLALSHFGAPHACFLLLSVCLHAYLPCRPELPEPSLYPWSLPHAWGFGSVRSGLGPAGRSLNVRILGSSSLATPSTLSHSRDSFPLSWDIAPSDRSAPSPEAQCCPNLTSVFLNSPLLTSLLGPDPSSLRPARPCTGMYPASSPPDRLPACSPQRALHHRCSAQPGLCAHLESQRLAVCSSPSLLSQSGSPLLWLTPSPRHCHPALGSAH